MRVVQDNQLVSCPVGPPCRTASVLKSKQIGVALSGMVHFKPMEVFDAKTASVLLAALLLYDLKDPKSVANPANPLPHPHDLLIRQSFHGGCLRCGFQQESMGSFSYVLGLVVPRAWPKATQPLLAYDTGHNNA